MMILPVFVNLANIGLEDLNTLRGSGTETFSKWDFAKSGLNGTGNGAVNNTENGSVELYLGSPHLFPYARGTIRI